MDKLAAMHVFVRVAECGSFSRAAESLNLANATVTTSVRKLERHLGVPLIIRDTRRLRLTEDGALYLERSRQLLAAHAAADEEVQGQIGALKGSLFVEAPITFGQTVLAPLLPEFARRYPDISTIVTLTNEPHDLTERNIDLAVRMDYVEDESLIARPFFEAAHIICGAPDLVKSLPAHPKDLDRKLCLGILPKDGRQSYPWHLKRGDERVELHAQGSLHFNSSEAVLTAAKDNAGLAYVLDIFAQKYITDGELVQAYAEWSMPIRPFYLVTSRTRVHANKVKAFFDFFTGPDKSGPSLSAFQSVPIKKLTQR